LCAIHQLQHIFEHGCCRSQAVDLAAKLWFYDRQQQSVVLALNLITV
jgi:hypothetical protein